MYGLILLAMIMCVEALLQKITGLFETINFLAKQTSELQMEVQCNTWEFEQFECRTVCDHQNLQLTFQVLNVDRPLISVGKLAKDGFEINFDGTGDFIHHKGRSLRFERVGDMFGIRVRVLGNSGGSNSVSGTHNPVMPTFAESSGLSSSASSSFNPMPSFDQEMSPLESGEAEPPQISSTLDESQRR